MTNRNVFAQIASYDRVFWICIFMEMLERTAYYGIRLVVPVFMVLSHSAGGPGLDHQQKGMIFALWAGTQSLLPVLTGGFSDRFGYKPTIAVSIVLKTLGYLGMALAGDFWMMLLGTQLLAAGTGLFKPGIQGTMAHSIAKAHKAGLATESMGWGLFYQGVNVGAMFSAYIPMFTRDVYGWPSLFVACSAIVASNLLMLFLYEDPVDERATEVDERSVLKIIVETITELATSGRLMSFIVISSGFWFLFNQIFDMLPNYVDDWTDSNVLYEIGARITGSEAMQAAAVAGEMVPQERLLNLNSVIIVFTMFLFAWLSGRVSALASTILGMLLSSLSVILLIISPSVWSILTTIVVFTIGEMLASPKRQEYIGSLAPPGKRGRYLGYANMPEAAGWVIGSLIAGSLYESNGDKVNLARDLFQEAGTPAVASQWLGETEALLARAAPLTGEAREEMLKASGWSQETINELVTRGESELGLDAQHDERGWWERMSNPLEPKPVDPQPTLAALKAMTPSQLVVGVAEVMPREIAVTEFVRLMPLLPDGTDNSPSALRDYLFVKYQPGQVWTPFFWLGLSSVVMMVVYDAWVRRNPAAVA